MVPLVTGTDFVRRRLALKSIELNYREQLAQIDIRPSVDVTGASIVHLANDVGIRRQVYWAGPFTSAQSSPRVPDTPVPRAWLQGCIRRCYMDRGEAAA